MSPKNLSSFINFSGNIPTGSSRTSFLFSTSQITIPTTFSFNNKFQEPCHEDPDTDHVLSQEAPPPSHDVPEVLLQGRDPVSRRAEVQASGTGLVWEEVSQKQVNDILKVQETI